MKAKKTTRLLLAAMATFASQAILAAPITYDFSSLAPNPGGNLEVSTTTLGPITINAYYYNTTSNIWSAANIFVRNESGESGLGVCSPGESATDCAKVGDFHGGGGDRNELSNEGKIELIGLTLAAGYTWDKVFLSSLDCNGSGSCSSTYISSYAEDAFLYYSSVVNPNDRTGTNTSLITHYFANGATSSPSIAITGAAQNAQTLFFDTTGAKGTNNDHLIWKASVEQVPEPGTLALVGLGLVGLWSVGRKRSI